MHSGTDKNHRFVISELVQFIAPQSKTLISLNILIPFLALMRANHQHINNSTLITSADFKLSQKNIRVILMLLTEGQSICTAFQMGVGIGEGELGTFYIFWEIEIKF